MCLLYALSLSFSCAETETAHSGKAEPNCRCARLQNYMTVQIFFTLKNGVIRLECEAGRWLRLRQAQNSWTYRSKTGHRRILSLPVLQVITIGFWILRKTGSESAAQRVQTGRTVIHAFLSEGESSLNRSWCVFSLFMYCLHPKRYHCYCSRSQ